jgi:dinuclear metal center YbgI/SA1388 family protein
VARVALADLTQYLDGYLGIDRVPDWNGALNGLQVDSPRPVGRVACAVDAAQATVDAAAAWGADLLLVHHGLFWSGNQALTGSRYRRLKAILAAELAVYAAHLPLDVHPEVGNNPLLARALGMDPQGCFAEYKGTPVGVWGTLETSREELAARLSAVLGGPVKLVPGGPAQIRRVGVITGSGADELAAARAMGLDALVTGEARHHHFFDAEEGGINLLLGGHYATETFGVKALGAHLAERFGVEWTFLDHPTGL